MFMLRGLAGAVVLVLSFAPEAAWCFQAWVPGVFHQSASPATRRWSTQMVEAATPKPAAPQRPKNKEVIIEWVQETPGGYIALANVRNFQAKTAHRMVMSKEQLAELGEKAGETVEPEQMFKYVIKYMMDKGMKLDNTEGMTDAAAFPVNYFTVKQLRYFHDDSDEKLVELIKQKPSV